MRILNGNQDFFNQSNNNTTLSPDLKSLITIISISTSSFSLLGCSFVIFMYIAFQILQQFSFKLVFYLSFSLLIANIGNLIVTSDSSSSINQNYCDLQGFLINFGGLSTVFWSIICCYYMKNLFINIDASYKIKDSLIISLGFGLPFILSFIPLAIDAYGYKNYICWISYEKDLRIELFLIFIEFYIPLWICFAYFFYILCRTSFKDPSHMNHKQLKKFSLIKLFPISLIFCWIWGSMDQIAEMAGFDIDVLKILHAFFGGIQGFWNSIFFFSAQEVKNIVKTQLCAMLPCFYNRKSSYKHRLQEDPNESKEENTENQEKKHPEQELVDC